MRVGLGFVALKLHTVRHAVEPSSADRWIMFAEAARLGVLVIAHTGGAGQPFASPGHVLPLAREWPDLPVVLAHAGMGVAARETGWSPSRARKSAWRPRGAGFWTPRCWRRWSARIGSMLGSDGAQDLGVEIAKHHALGLSPGELSHCPGGTTAKVFRL